MPDISMCKNNYCPSRYECYRYMAEPSSYWQTYADFTVEDGKDKCEYFQEIYKKEEK